MLPAAGTIHTIENSHSLYSHFNDISHQLTMHHAATGVMLRSAA